MESHKIPWFQSPPTSILSNGFIPIYPMDPMGLSPMNPVFLYNEVKSPDLYSHHGCLWLIPVVQKQPSPPARPYLRATVGVFSKKKNWMPSQLNFKSEKNPLKFHTIWEKRFWSLVIVITIDLHILPVTTGLRLQHAGGLLPFFSTAWDPCGVFWAKHVHPFQLAPTARTRCSVDSEAHQQMKIQLWTT